MATPLNDWFTLAAINLTVLALAIVECDGPDAKKIVSNLRSRRTKKYASATAEASAVSRYAPRPILTICIDK
jgi:hypothetical protein